MRPQKGTPEYEAMIQKISASAKRRMSDPDERAKFLENGKKGGFTKGQVPHNKGKHTGQVPWNKDVPMSEKTKAKVSAARKGIPRSAEAKLKTAESNRGKKRSPEQCANISEGRKGIKHSPETIANMVATRRGKPSSRRGQTLSDKHKANMSAARTGVPNTKLRGYKHTKEFSANAAARERAKWQNRSEDEKRAHIDKLHEGARHITDSWIENAYAKQLDAQRIVYERQKRIGCYRVDFYIEAENRIVEINGCYWHCCEQCGCGNEHPGKREKDMKRYEYLRSKGYIVEIVWEHDLPKKPYHRHRSRK